MLAGGGDHLPTEPSVGCGGVGAKSKTRTITKVAEKQSLLIAEGGNPIKKDKVQNCLVKER